MQALAELGFIVVQIDGMGTNNRSKAFHDVALEEPRRRRLPRPHPLAQGGRREVPVLRPHARRHLRRRRPAGRTRWAALLFHPEFYKVAVSDCGCHDNRMDKIWWNEQWMGWPIGPQYAASSNVDNAHKLQGKLLLVVGELDTNVDPASTMQVVNALIKANKNFDLLVVPGARPRRRAAPYGDAQALRLLRAAPARREAAGLEGSRGEDEDRADGVGGAVNQSRAWS